MWKWIKRQYYKHEYWTPFYEDVYGKFRVLYHDGRKSRPMVYKNAKNYAMMFNGKVIDNFS